MIFTQVKDCEVDQKLAVTGSTWTLNSLTPLNLNSLIADLTKRQRIETELAAKEKELKDRLEAEKKSPEVIFTELLYERDNILKLSDDLWPRLKEKEDVGKTIEEKVQANPDLIELKKWHDDEMEAIKAEEEEMKRYQQETLGYAEEEVEEEQMSSVSDESEPKSSESSSFKRPQPSVLPKTSEYVQ